MGAPKTVGLTEREKEFLSVYVRHKSVDKAAKVLNISPQLASHRKRSAIMKYMRAKEIVREFEVYKMQAPTILDA